MAEAVAAPVAIAGVNGGWAIFKKLRHSHPKCQLKRWEDKVATALERVQKQQSMIKPSAMRDLMQQHAMYCVSILLFDKDQIQTYYSF